MGNPSFPHRSGDCPVTSGPAPPSPHHTGPAERTAQLAQLADRLIAGRHDTFTSYPGLGLHAGNLYGAIGPETAITREIARALGLAEHQAQSGLTYLEHAGVVHSSTAGWKRASRRRLDQLSKQLTVGGRLEARRRRYSIERELWAWFQAETAWMRAPQRPALGRRPQRGQLALVPADGTHCYGPHPRTSDGALSWREARRIVESERGGLARRNPNEVQQRRKMA